MKKKCTFHLFYGFSLGLNDEVTLTLTRGSPSSVSHSGSLVTVELPIQWWSTGCERAEEGSRETFSVYDAGR